MPSPISCADSSLPPPDVNQEPMAKNEPFDPELVRELARMVAETDLSEIEVEKGDLRIRVARKLSLIHI